MSLTVRTCTTLSHPHPLGRELALVYTWGYSHYQEYNPGQSVVFGQIFTAQQQRNFMVSIAFRFSVGFPKRFNKIKKRGRTQECRTQNTGPVSHTKHYFYQRTKERAIKRHNIEYNKKRQRRIKYGFPDLLKVLGPSGADLVPPPARKTLHRSHNVNPLGARFFVLNTIHWGVAIRRQLLQVHFLSSSERKKKTRIR